MQPEDGLTTRRVSTSTATGYRQTTLSSGVYRDMTSIIKNCADRHCQGRIVSLLEGGYNLEALAESVEAHLAGLLG